MHGLTDIKRMNAVMLKRDTTPEHGRFVDALGDGVFRYRLLVQGVMLQTRVGPQQVIIAYAEGVDAGIEAARSLIAADLPKLALPDA